MTPPYSHLFRVEGFILPDARNETQKTRLLHKLHLVKSKCKQIYNRMGKNDDVFEIYMLSYNIVLNCGFSSTGIFIFLLMTMTH